MRCRGFGVICGLIRGTRSARFGPTSGALNGRIDAILLLTRSGERAADAPTGAVSAAVLADEAGTGDETAGAAAGTSASLDRRARGAGGPRAVRGQPGTQGRTLVGRVAAGAATAARTGRPPWPADHHHLSIDHGAGSRPRDRVAPAGDRGRTVSVRGVRSGFSEESLVHRGERPDLVRVLHQFHSRRVQGLADRRG